MIRAFILSTLLIASPPIIDAGYSLGVFGVSEALASSLNSVARRYSGLHERKHRKQLQAILGVDPVRVRWCGYFMATVVRRAGRKPPAGYPSARQWKRFGTPATPQTAKIAVFPGHVMPVESVSKGRVCGTGGNQSNRVMLKCRSTRGVIAWRK